MMKRAISAATTALLGAGPAWADATGSGYGSGSGSGYGSGGHMWGGGWGHGFFGPLMMLLLLAAIVAIVVLLVRWLGGGAAGPAHRPETGARALLDERYARGEIEREDYLQRKQDLS